MSAAEIFFCGNIILGRQLHRVAERSNMIENIPAMSQADLRIANLIGVSSNLGSRTDIELPKPQSGFRSRPEMINILARENFDIVLTGNHHAGDYGTEALLDHNRLLERAGILRCGSGADLDRASEPVFARAGELIVAVFSVDTMIEEYAATEDRAGTFYLPLDQAERWKDCLSEKIRAARRHAHIVLVAINWQVSDLNKPTEQMRSIGRLVIDLGADGVLGCNGAIFNYVEKYRERPIIYGAGMFLRVRKSEPIDSVCFSLIVERNGIRSIRVTPVRCGFGHTLKAKKFAARIVDTFIQTSLKFGTPAEKLADDLIEIAFAPPESTVEPEPIELPALERHAIEPTLKPIADWIVERVPDDAIIRPTRLGSLKLLGYRVSPETITRRQLLVIESYWSIDEPIDREVMLTVRAVPVRECGMTAWGTAEGHELCNWLFPIRRWTPGVIYRDCIALGPPKTLVNIDLRLEFRVSDADEIFRPEPLIEMHLPLKIYHKKKYPESIYQSKLDQLWTARQLADATDGEWLVPLPDERIIQSVCHRWTDLKRPEMRAPILFAPEKNFWTSAVRPKVLPPSIGAVAVGEPRNDLPPNLPQLLVRGGLKASIELGFAARSRFRGIEIAITGSSGKTTTSHMLYHVLSPQHSVFMTYGNQNITLCPVVFANIPQNASFALIEMASSAFSRARGSISVDLPPHIAIVTSLSEAHIERHGSLEGVAKIKSRIFDGMSPGGYAILNRDMPFFEIFEKRARERQLNIITFGSHPDSTLRMKRIASGESFIVSGSEHRIECPVPDNQIYDALAACATIIALGFSLDDALEKLKSFSPVIGRGNRIGVVRNGKSFTIINSTFNANIGSMSGDLPWLKTLEPQAGSRVAILGDIAELGENAAALHLKLVRPILDAELDRVLLIGENMKHVWDRIKDKVCGAWFPTPKAALGSLDEWLKDGDTVFVKSSHSTHLDQIVKYLRTGKK